MSSLPDLNLNASWGTALKFAIAGAGAYGGVQFAAWAIQEGAGLARELWGMRGGGGAGTPTTTTSGQGPAPALTVYFPGGN